MNTTSTLLVILLSSFSITFTAVAQPQRGNEQASAERLQIGDKAPTLDIAQWLTKSDEMISEFKPGHIYVIDFWGTWCGACISEMPELAKIQKDFAKQNVTIIGVTDETPDEVNAFLDRSCHHNDEMTYRELTSVYRIAADPDGSVFKDYMRGIERRSFPMMAIVGKTGLIEYIGSTTGLRRTLESIVADKWNREAIRNEQLANWKARETMLEVNDLRRDGKIDAAIDVLNLKFKQAVTDLRAINYQIESQARRAETGSDLLKRLEDERRAATVECIRWERNRFGFLLSQRSSEAVEPFRDLCSAYDSSPSEQLNFAWRIYREQDMGTKVDPLLILAAKDVAEAALEKQPNNAMFLDVYAHLQHSAGETDAAIETFQLALEKATDVNRARVKSDYQAFLKSIDK